MRLEALVEGEAGWLQHCGRCGARAFVSIIAKGASLSYHDDANDPEVQKHRLAQAFRRQQRHAKAVLRLVRCPACHKRRRMWFMRPLVLVLVLAGIGVALGLTTVIPVWLSAPATGLLGLHAVMDRLRRANGAAFTRVESDGDPRSGPVIPNARVVHAPAIQPTEIVRGPAVEPAPQPAPAAPGAEPSLLGKPD